MGDHSPQAPQRDNHEPAGAEQSPSQEKTPAPASHPPRGLGVPSPSSPADIPLTRNNLLFLQRAIGNHAVERLVQRKAKISQPGDEYEREADRVAERVMTATPRPARQDVAPGDEQEVQAKSPAGTTTPLLRRQAMPEEERKKQEEEKTVQTMPALQRKDDGGSVEAGRTLENRLANSGGGSPLPDDVRAFMEPRFGADFSEVRVHTGSEAVQMNRDVSARAFTHGSDIYFGAGHGPGNLDLTAHELTHVVQQTGGGALPTQGAPGVQRRQEKGNIPANPKEESARFEGDKKLEDVTAGADKVSKGARGLTVTKLQQALVDLGYLLPGAVDGKFEAQTKAALTKFQKARKIPESGELDAATMKELHAAYDTRKPYVNQARHVPAAPGTHPLSAADKAAAVDAMVPAPVPGAPSTFTEDLGPPKGKYGPRIKAELTTLIAALHKELFADKEPLRADPAKNFHDWPVIEAPARAAKDVVDKVYASNYGGAAAKPAMTHAGGNLIDQWEDEIAANAGLTAGPGGQKEAKARDKVWYLINSNCETINGEHSAVPSAPAEQAILTPIVESFVSDAAKVQKLLELDIGWEGAQLDGKVYLQRYKSTDPDAAKAKEANRVQMWGLFHTCIHEYLHTLAHPNFRTWARSFRTAGDVTRYNTLTEGFCDFFTLNVRTTVAPATVQAQVEGPYANGNPPPAVNSGLYPSHQQAEQVVSIVGIKNAQQAYFAGKTELMGGP